MPSLSYQNLLSLLTTIRDEKAIHANTALRVGTAMIELLRYLMNGPFLHKDQADQTNYLLTLLAGAVIGESGQIRLNADGSISCSRLTVEGSAVFDEVVFNHQNVLEGDTYFTDKGIIEEVTYLGNNQYRLLLRKEYANEVPTFHAYDVLRCSMNNLDAARTFRTSWLRVDSVDTATCTMDVTMYDGEDVPGGVNYEPMPAARLVRWGNQVDQDRQQVFFVSSTEGRFLFLQGVTQPILTDGNYSAFFGVPPTLSFLQNLPLNARQPYLYAKGIIVEDLIFVDYQGNPKYTARDCGQWYATHQYIHGYDEVARGYFTDRVWWGGCLWQAAVALPTLGREPRYNNADWVCLIGGKNMSMEIISTNDDHFPAGKRWTTTLIAELWNAEMKLTEEEIGREHITWQRISEDTQGDIAWNILHATGTQGLQLDIDSEVDVSGEWNANSKVAFQCDIYIPEHNDTYSTHYSIMM